jgi:hypothetical protein
MANIDLDINGQALIDYRGEVSLIGSIHKVKEKGVSKRKVFFATSKGFEGKCRYEKYILNWREPHLGKMIKHLKKELKL